MLATARGADGAAGGGGGGAPQAKQALFSDPAVWQPNP